ncbi:MAG: B-box zinc finger protein [Sandaracinaceae bacterium]
MNAPLESEAPPPLCVTHGDAAIGACSDCRQPLCDACVDAELGRCSACRTAHEQARMRPPVLWAALAISASGLLFTAALAGVTLYLVLQAQAGELSAFEQGMVQGMGALPEDFGMEQAGEFDRWCPRP